MSDEALAASGNELDEAYEDMADTLDDVEVVLVSVFWLVVLRVDVVMAEGPWLATTFKLAGAESTTMDPLL